MNNRGISLISLIITIIVIIILAAIVIFSGFNTMQKAQLARYVSEVSGLQDAVTNDYANRKQNLALKGITRTDEQIYYMIASGKTEEEVKNNEDIEEAKNVSELGIDIKPTGLTGEVYYRITSDTNIKKINSNKYYGSKGEVHYLTDKGEAFILPGYRDETEEGIKYWINASKYYEGEKSTTPGGTTPPTPAKTMKLGDTVQYKSEQNEEVEWKIWKINGSDIVITPASPVGELELTGIEGENGWLNAETAITNYCKRYKNDALGITESNIRSMNIKDIEKALGESKVAEFKDSDYGTTEYKPKGISNGLYVEKADAGEETFDGYNKIIDKITSYEGEPDKAFVETNWKAENLTSADWSDEAYYNILDSEDTGWLASRCIGGNVARAIYNVHVVRGTDVSYYYMDYSDQAKNVTTKRGVRPLITISKTLIKEGESEGSWKVEK